MVRRVDLAIVHDGKVTVSGLPLPDGERVQVTVTTASGVARQSIADVRNTLRGCVERYDAPFEPSIPEASWEMLK